MLAKIWKKLLLAICIIACVYNIMHKLVSRTSLESNLRSAMNETSIINSRDENSNNERKDSSEKEANETEKDNDTIVVIY